MEAHKIRDGLPDRSAHERRTWLLNRHLTTNLDAELDLIRKDRRIKVLLMDKQLSELRQEVEMRKVEGAEMAASRASIHEDVSRPITVNSIRFYDLFSNHNSRPDSAPESSYNGGRKMSVMSTTSYIGARRMSVMSTASGIGTRRMSVMSTASGIGTRRMSVMSTTSQLYAKKQVSRKPSRPTIEYPRIYFHRPRVRFQHAPPSVTQTWLNRERYLSKHLG